MPPSFLVLWPRDARAANDAVVQQARQAAPERAPLEVLVAGGPDAASVGDLRLDDRSALAHGLGVPLDTSDARLIDAAFARWGRSFPAHLTGDFAWARWDPATREVLLVRDHLGIKPLVTARYRDGFAAASDIRCLQALPGIDLRLDERFLAMVLTDIYTDTRSTIARGIKRVSAGHLARVRDHGRLVQLVDHWRLPHEDLRLGTEQDYLDRFRATFLAAVRDRIPTTGTVATELSGGLDSTVVTAAVAEHRATPEGGGPTLALAASFAERQYQGGRYDEGRHRAWARVDPRVRLLELPASAMITPAAIQQLLDVQGQPLAPVMDLVRLALWKTARTNHVAAILDGFDGDTAINYGFERFLALARHARFAALAKELGQSYRVAGRLGLREAFQLMTYSTYHELRSHWREPRVVTNCLASRALLERSGFLDALRDLPRPRPGDVRGEHVFDLRCGDTAMSIERLDIVATAASIPVHHPFFDRRLVELAVSLPSDLLFRDRMPRWIERAALKGLGPKEVLWRHDKGGMPPQLQQEAIGGLPAFDANRPIDDNLFDAAAFARTHTRWNATGDIETAYALYPALTYCAWSDRRL